MTPEFAVIGHPNEGKSSVVSTLTEDDGIKISRTPGETTVSTQYTVTIDGREVIRFVDTPGFQVPSQTLAWFRQYDGPPEKSVDAFIEAHKKDPFFADECELLGPLTRGAGIIYVVDGSRPPRKDDLAEMEILRLTGRPRMAVINSKVRQKDFTEQWRHEFRKTFNSIRLFNSNTANFTDRIRLMESLKSIDQDWEPHLSRVVQVYQQDWKNRTQAVTSAMLDTLSEQLKLQVSKPLSDKQDRQEVMEQLKALYQSRLKEKESKLFKKIRQLFKHNLYKGEMPEHSLLQHDLFSTQTWQLLGLTRKQLATAGAIIGGTMGAVADTAAAGITFGVFTAIGGLIGAGSALIGGEKMAENFKLGGNRLYVGPNKDLQFFYILLDRALIFYSNMVNRPHGRRDDGTGSSGASSSKKGYTAQFTSAQRSVCTRYFKQLSGKNLMSEQKAVPEFRELLKSILTRISSQGGEESI